MLDSFFFSSGKVLSDARQKIEEKLYLHYITESIYVTWNVTVYILLYCACGTSVLSEQH